MDLVSRLLALTEPRDEPVWLVGGCVRDRLLGRDSPDLDAVTVGAVELAKRLAKSARAFFVLLDDGRGTARVITRDRRTQLDLTELTVDLETDLRRRDFTINAIACPLADWRSAAPAYLDPCGGIDDLRAQRIRAVTAQSLGDDPLRVLRAYRFQATLGFQVEPRTAERVRAAAPRLGEVAAERVWQEWLPLLASPGAVRALEAMAADGVLSGVAPVAEPARVAALEPAVAVLAERLPGWLDEDDRRPLLRFAALLGPEGAEPTAEVARRLAMSRAQRRRLTAYRTAPRAASDRTALAALALAEGEEAAGILALTAALGQLTEETLGKALAILAEKVFPVMRSKPLLSGHDLQQELGLAPGPAYGPVLAAVRLAELAGRVTGRDEALALAAEVLAEHG